MAETGKRIYLSQVVVTGIVTTGPLDLHVSSTVVNVCSSCGALVMSQRTHDEWHDDMNKVAYRTSGLGPIAGSSNADLVDRTMSPPDDDIIEAYQQERERHRVEPVLPEIVQIAARILERAERHKEAPVRNITEPVVQELMWAYRQFPSAVHEAVSVWRGKPIVR